MDFLQNKNRLTASCHETEFSAVPLMFARMGALFTGPSTFCLNATTRTDLPPQCVCIHGFTLSARKRYPVGTSCHALAPPAHSLRHSVPRLLRHSRSWLLYHIFPGLSRLNPNFFAHSPDFRRRAHPRRISPRRLSSCIRFRESHTARRRTSRRRNRRFPRIRNRRFRVR